MLSGYFMVPIESVIFTLLYLLKYPDNIICYCLFVFLRPQSFCGILLAYSHPIF